MKRTLIVGAIVVAVLSVASSAGERPIVPCTTDSDCAQKNPDYCGGPYEPQCRRQR